MGNLGKIKDLDVLLENINKSFLNEASFTQYKALVRIRYLRFRVTETAAITADLQVIFMYMSMSRSTRYSSAMAMMYGARFLSPSHRQPWDMRL